MADTRNGTIAKSSEEKKGDRMTQWLEVCTLGSKNQTLIVTQMSPSGSCRRRRGGSNSIASANDDLFGQLEKREQIKKSEVEISQSEEDTTIRGHGTPGQKGYRENRSVTRNIILKR